MTINSSLKLHLCTLYMLKVLHHKMELLQPLPKLPGSFLVCCDVGEAIEDVFKPSFIDYDIRFIDYQIFKNSNLFELLNPYSYKWSDFQSSLWMFVKPGIRIHLALHESRSDNLPSRASSLSKSFTRGEISFFANLTVLWYLEQHLLLVGSWSLLVWKHLQNGAFHSFVGFGLSSKRDLVGLGQIQHLAAIGFKLKRFTDL